MDELMDGGSSDKDWGRHLFPHLTQIIKDSSISEEVARDRGYRSVRTKSENCRWTEYLEVGK